MRKKRKKQILLAGFLIMALLMVWICHDAKNAFAYKVEDVGASKLYENGWASVVVNGPLGSDRLGIKFTNLDYKNCKVGTFNDSSHNIQVEGSGAGGGVYHTSIDVQKVKTKVNPDTGAYSYIDFIIKYDIPAHEEYASEKKDGIEYKFSTNGIFQIQAVHATTDRKQMAIRCTVSVSTVGLATIDQKRYSLSVLTLNLKRAEHTIQYNENGKDAHLSYTSKKFADGSTFEFPDAQREGYTFTGWKKKSGEDPAEDAKVCSDYVFEAQWKANQYTIHYDANGGTGSMNDSSVTYNGKYTLSKGVFHKSGYSFLGWSKTKESDVADYDDQEEITYKTASDLTLYAVWGNGQYKVSFNPNGAPGDQKAVTIKTGETTALEKNSYVRKGYIFLGWNTDENASSVSYRDGQNVTDLTDAGQSVKLYAIWKKSDGSFNTTNIIHDEDMFTGDIEIEGGNGTGYDSGHTDSGYARIDQDDTPGYFTKR